MAGTTISELGKMFNQSTQSVQGTESNTRITTGKVDWFYDETVRKPSDSILCRD